jgi:hypothetical protein
MRTPHHEALTIDEGLRHKRDHTAGPMAVNRMARLKAVICLQSGTPSRAHCDPGNITFLFILNQNLAETPSMDGIPDLRTQRQPSESASRGCSARCPRPWVGCGMHETAPRYQSAKPPSICTILPQPNARLMLSARASDNVDNDTGFASAAFLQTTPLHYSRCGVCRSGPVNSKPTSITIITTCDT